MNKTTLISVVNAWKKSEMKFLTSALLVMALLSGCASREVSVFGDSKPAFGIEYMRYDSPRSLSITSWDPKKVFVVEHIENGKSKSTSTVREFVPSPERWKEFAKTVENLDLQKWHSAYANEYNPLVVIWDFDFLGKTSYHGSGLNAYPSGTDARKKAAAFEGSRIEAFMRATETLCDAKFVDRP